MSGCDKRTTYLVACNKFRSACEAGPVPTSSGSAAPRQLADELEPDAVNAAQQRGARDFACPATTAKVTRQETISEGQTTGWGAEAPRRALYAMTVKGCGKQTAYLVECDTGKKGCVTAGSQPSQAGSQPPQLADELQPGAGRQRRNMGPRNSNVRPPRRKCAARKRLRRHRQPVGMRPRTALYTR